MIEELIDEILLLRKPAIVTISVTAFLFIICLVLMKKISVTGKYNKFLGLFFGLSQRSTLHLTFAWIKFIYFCSILCIMQYASSGYYLIIGFLIIACAFLAKEKKLIAMELIGGLLLITSTWVCSVFVQYFYTVRSDIYVLGAYWIIAIFMMLCSVVILLYEVISISKERTTFEANKY